MNRLDAASKTPAFLALSCIGFIASAPGLAQTAAAPSRENDQRPVELEGVTVTDTALDEGYKAERAETPKAVAPLLNTPRSIVVVDKQVIKDTGSATLVDALRTVPGITFGAAEGGNPIGDRPFIRGFDSQGSTFVDGVRDIGAQSREVFNVEQIQVVRGSDSTLGGRGSAGGSLNIISKLPGRRTEASVAGSYGNADYKRITGDVNYRVNDLIAVRLNAMWHDQDVAGRDAIYQKRWGVAPSLTIGIEEPTKLIFSYYHLNTDELPDSGIPYAYTIGNAPLGYTYSQPPIGDFTTIGGRTGRIDRDTFYGLKDRDFRKTRTDQFMIRAQHDFGGITLRNTSRFNHNYQGYIFTQPDDQQGNVFGTAPVNTVTAGVPNFINGGYVWRRANTRYGTTNSFINQTDLYGQFETGSIRHSFAIGAELALERAERGAYVLATGSTVTPRCNANTVARFYCTSLFDPNPSDPYVNYTSDTSNVATPVAKGDGTTRTLNTGNTKGVYAFDSVTLVDWAILNLGARYDRYENRTTLPALLGIRPKVSRNDGIFNWQAGLTLKPTTSTSLYGSYATSSTPPNSLIGEGQEGNGLGTVPATVTAANLPAAIAALQQAANDVLKVERTKSYEVGAKAELFGGALSVNGAAFITRTTNARVTSDTNTVAFIGKRKIKGFELGFNGNITDKLNVFGGYTYLDAKISDGGFTALTAAAVPGQPARTVLVNSVNTGRRFPQTAKHSVSAWANYKFTPKLSIGGGAFYTSRVFGGYSDNRTATQTAAGVVTVNPATKIIARSIPSYWRFDARAGWTINDHLDLAVNVQNLTNKTYFNQAYTAHYASIAPGRTAFGTLTFKY